MIVSQEKNIEDSEFVAVSTVTLIKGECFMKSITGTLIVVLAMAVAASTSFGDYGYYDDLSVYSLLKSIDNSSVVATGTVALLTGAYRQNLTGAGKHAICTDVLIRVDTMIKGTPNFGTNHIKFAVRGGTAYVPAKDEVMTMWVSTQAKFEAGEKVLIMLTNDPNTTFYANYPYGRSRLIYDDYGKRLIKDDKVKFLYEKDSQVKPMELSIELATNLGKAFLENKEEAIQLEDQIKALARDGTSNTLSSTLTNSLNTSAKQILDRRENQ